MFTNFFSEVPPRNWSTVAQGDKERYGRFFRAMLENGVYFAPSAFEAGFMSTVHTDADIVATVNAAEKAFKSW
jgi:glutamate-1-semialdehyde 2,1-aminomutase